MSDTPPDADVVAEDIPRPLRERVASLFVAYRGYEPSSFQEALSVVCDVAAGRLGDRRPPDQPPAAPEPGSVPEPGERIDTLEAVFPEDWNADPVVRERLPTVVDRYVENPEGLAGAERERDALAAAAEGELTPAAVRESLVATLYDGTGLPEGLAREFFSEALEEAADVARSPPTGVRPATADGGAAGATPSVEEGFAAALLDDGSHVDTPTADCEGCGAETPVDALETVIAPDDGSTVRLLCGECADGT